MRNSRLFKLQKRFAYLHVIYCIAGLLVSLLLNAQSNPEKGLPFITNYTPKTFKALPQAWCIIEDGRGIMYFGVQSTILEYDGVKWRKVIFKGPTPPSVIRSLARDKNGVIYYGAAGDFGYLVQDSLGQTQAVSLRQYVPESYRNFFDVWTIYVNGSEIYFQSREYIFRMNEKKEIKTWIPKNKFMYAFFYDDTYFVHQQGVGLLKLVKDSLQLIPGSEFLGQERMQVMLPYNPPSAQANMVTGKQYLVGLFYSGLFLFDGKNFSPFKTEADELIKAATLYKAAQLSNGNYALSTTGKGLAILDAGGKILQLINRDVGLQDESVYSVYSDSKGTLWLALDNGISRVETNSPLTQFTNQSGINTATLSIQRFEGKLYVGTTNGLLKFNSQSGRFDDVAGIPPNQTFRLLKDGNTLLVPNDGFFSIHNDKTTLIRSSIGGDLQLSGLFISKHHPDMLLGGATFGVTVFYRDKGTKTWRFKGHIPNMDDQFWTFSENKDGTIWAGTQSASVYRLTPAFDKNGQPDIHRFSYEKFGEAQGLKNSLGAVYTIKGESWFVGDSSLYKFDEKQKRFYPDTTFGHFTNGGGTGEFDMIEDYAGRVWLRFGKETILATPQPNGKYRIDKTPLLPVADRSFSTIYPEANGIVWLCTTDGLVRYDENREKNYTLPFKTLLRHITAGKDILNPSPDTTDKNKTAFSFKNNTLRFEYAAPFFEQEDKTLYQTWLEGFETDWSGFDNNYYKEYTNLPAGKYHFHVRAKNVYQKLSEETVYSFTIKPPWYASWWAYTLYALAAAALIYLIVRYRTRQLHEKHRELEKTVARRTSELSHRVEELAVINSVQEGLVKEMGIQDIYDLVGEKIRAIFNAQVIDIVTYDSKTNLLEDRYAYEKGDRSLLGPREPHGFRKYVIETRQVQVINEGIQKRMLEYDNKVLMGEESKSVVFVPLITSGEIKGIISLQDLDKEHAFSDSDVSLLTTLANSMSVALESARRFDETNRLLKETEQRNAELAVINSVQESLVAKMDIQGIYELVGEKIREIFDAQVIDIVTYDKDLNLIEDRYAYEKGDRTLLGKRPPNGFRKYVIQTRQLLLHNENVEQATRDFDNEILIGDMPKSQMYVPMIAGNEVKAIISLQNLDHEQAFSNSDVSLLTTLANSMSVALESARLFDETNRLLKETEQRTAELAVINSVQEGLAKELDIQSIYELVGNTIKDVFNANAQAVIIANLDQATKTEHFNYVIEKGERFYLNPRPYDKLRGHLVETREKILINKNDDEASAKFDLKTLPGTEYPKSLLFVPLISGDKVKSYVSLQNIDKENAFSDADVRLLETLANSMSVALENARLFDETTRLLKETEQRNAELAVINSVQESLVAKMDIKGIYDLVGEKIREIFDAQVIDIVTYDPNKNLIEDQYSFEKGDRTLIGPREPKGFRKHVIQTSQFLLHNDNVEQATRDFDNAVLIGEMPKSQVFVPMIAGGIVKGVISLQNLDHENAFSNSDVSLLTTLANSMSVALESARLFDETTRLLKETEQRNAELAVINSVQDGLVREMDIQGIYDLVGEKMREIFDAQVIDIVTYDRKANLIEDRYSFEKGDRTLLGSREPKGFRKHVIDNMQPLFFNDDVDNQAITYNNPILTGEAPKSFVMVPMIAGNEITGVISLQNVDHEHAFSESDISLLTTLSNSMSVALESARLFDETNRLLKETEQRTAELAVINSVQEGLARELNMQAIYDLVGEKIREIFNAQVIDIVTYDDATNLIADRYTFEKGDRTLLEPRPLKGFRKYVIETKKPLVINREVEQERSKYDNTVIIGEAAKSLVFVPMIASGKATGVISLQNLDEEDAFPDSDVRLLSTLVNSMSVALENARLFDETNRLLKETELRKAELATINSVQEGLVKEFKSQAIYELVGERLCGLFDTQTVLIRTFDHEAGMENWRYAIEKGQRQFSEPRPLIWANKQMIQTHQPILINENYLETAKKFGGSGVSMGKPPKSAVFVPMIVGDNVRGSVSLQNVDKEHAFKESDLRLLTTLTNSMGVALENARLFDETTLLLAEAKQRATELSTVNNISKALASQLDPDDLIKLVGDQLKDLFNANIVYLALLNKKTKTIHFPYQYGDDNKPMKLGEGLSSKIILTGEPLLINKDVQELRAKLGVQTMGIPAASYLGVPIPVGDEIIGVLSVQSTEHENKFNENDLRLLSTIASSVGVALSNARLFEEVQQSKMEAEAASKFAEKANEAKSAFLSTVSHELRTPLTSVLGFAKIIRKRLDEKIFPAVNKADPKTEKTITQISENLQVVISEGERLTHLINDVLDLAKIEAGKMEWNQENVSMPEVAERAIAATTSLYEQKSLKLIKEIDNNLPEIIGDRDKLIQVIINLISNAVKFTDKGSITCRVYQEKDELIVSISDTGIGIAPEDFDAVFEQFKQVGGDTLTDKPKGTGLGLPICKEIVEHHGGRIWLESERTKGSIFSFALPITAKTEVVKPLHLNDLVKQLKEQMAQSNFNLNGNHATILVVDDDDSIRSLLNQELGDAGYTIEEAANGKEALASIRNHRPDLIILDVMMPEMNGFDVAAILKNDPQTMDIPIIVLSIVQDKARGFRIGVDRYLTKPIDTAQLFSEVGLLLEQGKSKKKVLVVDEDSTAVRTLTEVLQAKGYVVVESDGKELVEKAILTQPDIIILNSVLSDKQEIVQSLRFEKGLENVLFLIYQ